MQACGPTGNSFLEGFIFSCELLKSIRTHRSVVYCHIMPYIAWLSFHSITCFCFRKPLMDSVNFYFKKEGISFEKRQQIFFWSLMSNSLKTFRCMLPLFFACIQEYIKIQSMKNAFYFCLSFITIILKYFYN